MLRYAQDVPRNTLKLKKKNIYIYIYICSTFKQKKKIVTEQNNGRKSLHQAQQITKEATHRFSKKKKKPNPNTKQITKSETSNQ